MSFCRSNNREGKTYDARERDDANSTVSLSTQGRTGTHGGVGLSQEYGELTQESRRESRGSGSGPGRLVSVVMGVLCGVGVFS